MKLDDFPLSITFDCIKAAQHLFYYSSWSQFIGSVSFPPFRLGGAPLFCLISLSAAS